MEAIDANPSASQSVSVTSAAAEKMNALLQEVDDNIEGIRVFATPGGCSGVSFGMTFTDQIAEQDSIIESYGCKVIVDNGTMEYVRGVEIDFVDSGDGEARFVFNNLQPMSDGGGCGTCGSQGGCG